ncbi:MAG: ACT domain-containing protein [Oscillospiraceae bacterium]|nr:ACT domain-containing protein [Oscillospiraceae bacterium]
MSQYLIVHKSILPDYYEKVIEARKLMESGKVKEVSQAVKQVGISRSTYYKYKDYLFEPTDIAGERKAVLSMMLDHTPGVLSALLRCISDAGASVLTITQSLPIHDMASVTLSLDLSGMTVQIAELIETIAATPGVDKVRLLAVE